MPQETQFTNNRLFRGVAPEVLDRVIPIPRIVDFDTDEMIFDEGDPADGLYLIASGCVRISKRGRGGQQETLAYLESDDFFGEMALYDPAPRSARATATEPTRLGRIGRADLDKLLRLAPVEVSTNLTKVTIERLRQTDAHLIREVMEAERLSLVGSMASTIIHDFKNPINVILGAASLLEKRADDPGLVRYCAMIRRSVDRMLVMIQELLDFSRGTSDLTLESVSVGQLLAELDEQVLDRLPDVGVSVERRVAYSGTLRIDHLRFVRMLLNIIKNAVEAMPQGGTLTLTVDQRENDAKFVVSDTGHGIPHEILPTIFEPFVTYGKAGGTGLGMALVRSVVEAHRGTITVESAPGEGTTLTIIVPNPAAE